MEKAEYSDFCILTRALHTELKLKYSSQNEFFAKIKIRNRTNSEYSVNYEYSETPVFASKTGFLTGTYF
jgi:hypothetical protein